MGTRVAALQVLRWTVRHTTCSVSSPVPFGRCHLRPLCTGCRLLCSSTDQSNELSSKPVSELPPHSLRDMGFTDTQAEQIHEVVSRLRGGSAAKHALSTLTALLVLGLNPSTVLKLLEKCPELYTVKESLLQQRIVNMRKLGLGEGSLQRVVSHYPQILTVPVKTTNRVVMFLRDKCLFTVQQVKDILRDCPAIVLENMGQLEYKFQVSMKTEH
ncbi:transcription termination factor 4, mitochondrial-like [Plectropomus leopardus]|uniref:transcription termination factor 4, mitochondrial-like n=1 Tax=Plectropomus leopardus TaxID=160734 RepID=UPI001C4CF4F2|nr:transcription termination factor 4, mitochondrial-like [Plectropomus leopardus]